MTPSLVAVTARDRELLDRLSQHEPLSTSELRLLFFSGVRTCRERLVKLEAQDLLTRVYPARDHRGGRTEALWFLSPHGRRTIGAPGRRPPGLSIPDLEHRRAVARFFVGRIEWSVTRPGEGVYRWLGEQQAQHGTGASVRPDGYGRYLLADGEITFYLEIDRATEPARRVKAKLDAYRQALAADPHRDRGNILLVCEGRRRLSNLARCAPPGPPWVWGSTDRRALLVAARTRAATSLQGASRRTSPRRASRRGLSRPPLALADRVCSGRGRRSWRAGARGPPAQHTPWERK
jgi:hypothetical protein